MKTCISILSGILISFVFAYALMGFALPPEKQSNEGILITAFAAGHCQTLLTMNELATKLRLDQEIIWATIKLKASTAGMTTDKYIRTCKISISYFNEYYERIVVKLNQTKT